MQCRWQVLANLFHKNVLKTIIINKQQINNYLIILSLIYDLNELKGPRRRESGQGLLFFETEMFFFGEKFAFFAFFPNFK